MAGEFWLDDDQWAVICRCFRPTNPALIVPTTAGLSVRSLTSCDPVAAGSIVASCDGPPTTVYNRFHCWSAKGIRRRLFEALVQTTDRDIHIIDSTTAKAHRSAAYGKGGADTQAIGRSTGGRSTKIHAVVDSFISAVPAANKQAYIQHAQISAALFKEYGALSVVECWGDNVPEGKINSLHTAVMRKEDETVVFSWVTWPDKATRDAGWAKLMADPRMQPDVNPMPFDGSRLIYGGFEMVVGP